MTDTLVKTPPPAPPPDPVPVVSAGPTRVRAVLETTARWIMALAGAFIIFSALLLSKDVDPLQTYADIWTTTFARPDSLEAILVKLTPFVLAALAVVVPARAGMVNVGGEGQIMMGAIAACGVGLALDQKVQGPVVLVLMFVAAAIAGALWAGIAAVMRMTVKVNEAITTLLLNYVAVYFLLFLTFQPWKDPTGGQPATTPLAERAWIPVFQGTEVNLGIVVAVIAVVLVWFALSKTTWGFRLSVVGGNGEAARRAGLPVTKLLLSAMLVGGALAGLAGWVYFAGVEHQLRPGFAVNIGYIGFLASWLARHRPIPVLLASFAFAAITVAGDSLQLDAGLPAATVNILTGLILIAVLGWTTTKVKA